MYQNTSLFIVNTRPSKIRLLHIFELYFGFIDVNRTVNVNTLEFFCFVLWPRSCKSLGYFISKGRYCQFYFSGPSLKIGAVSDFFESGQECLSLTPLNLHSSGKQKAFLHLTSPRWFSFRRATRSGSSHFKIYIYHVSAIQMQNQPLKLFSGKL